MSELQGRRRANDTDVLDLDVGDYVLRESRRQMALRLPDGAFNVLPVRDGEQGEDANGIWWGLTEHDDGTITLTPSIECKGENYWHGHLREGVWSW